MGILQIGPIAFLLTFTFLIALRPVARALDLLDSPGRLKRHDGQVPLIGGVAIMLGLSIALSIVPSTLLQNAHLLIAGLLVVMVGTLDDRFHLPPKARLMTHIAAALVVSLGSGLYVTSLGNPFGFGEVQLGLLSLPFTVLVIVGAINALNMVDGMDGLAAGLSFLGLFFLLSVAAGASTAWYAMVIGLLFSVAAFLLFNLPISGNRRMRAFLGDAGSMLLGLSVAWLSIELCQGESPLISPMTALWFVALPVYDVLTTTVRRLSLRRSPLHGDRLHMHHLLQRAGLSVRNTLLTMGIMALALGLLGLLGHYWRLPDYVQFAAFVAVGGGYTWLLRAIPRIGRPQLARRRARQN